MGFSPKHQHEAIIEGLTSEQILALSVESLKALDWKVSYISPNGLIAYTSTSMFSANQEITVKIIDNKIQFKSESIGSELFDIMGRHKKNSARFFSKFKYLQGKTNVEKLDEIYNEISSTFVSKEDDILNQPPKSAKENIRGFFSIFIPKQGFFVTPILIDLNVIVFILMIINGAGFILPDNQILLNWGANFKPLTLDGGQWWRLFASTFIHAGFFHLLMNMYALLYIGLLLEPYLGKARFSILYVLTGLLASTTSLCWHDFTVCVGASGAIFGLYGIFLAMLTTNLIEKTARKAFLTSIGIFVAYNLLNGMKGNIDNAAHIGGLLSGMLLGYGAYFSLREKDKFEHDMKMIKNLAFSAVMSILLIVIIFNVLEKKYTLLDNRMKRFATKEINALSIYRLNKNIDTSIINKQLIYGFENWHECELILDSIDKMDLPIHLRVRNDKFKKYVGLRKEAYTIIKDGIRKDSLDKKLLDLKNSEIEKVINEIKNN